MAREIIVVDLVKVKNEILALNKNGKQFKIQAVIIKKLDNKYAIYKPDTYFFKLVCAEGTKHKAEVIDDSLVYITDKKL